VAKREVEASQAVRSCASGNLRRRHLSRVNKGVWNNDHDYDWSIVLKARVASSRLRRTSEVCIGPLWKKSAGSSPATSLYPPPIWVRKLGEASLQSSGSAELSSNLRHALCGGVLTVEKRFTSFCNPRSPLLLNQNLAQSNSAAWSVQLSSATTRNSNCASRELNKR